jgi:hypothetical protein
MRIDDHNFQQLREAIYNYDFPMVAYDFISKEVKSDLHSYRMLEQYIRDLLLSENPKSVRNGLSNVLYWGYATSPGRQRDRVHRFRSQVADHQLSAFSNVISKRTPLSLFDIRDCKLPQFSRLSFISKVLMFIDPGKYVTLDLQISKIKRAGQSSMFRQLDICPTYLPVNGHNQLFYVSWCNLCSRIAVEYFHTAELRAVDVERGIFMLVREGEIELAATIVSQAEP